MPVLPLPADTTRMNVIPSQVDALQRYLIENAEQQAVASKNIANLNTPGYKAERVTFEDALTSTSSETERRLTVRSASTEAARLDGNNVDIDQELGALKKSSLKHQVYTQLLGVRIRQMRSAMSDQ